MKQEDIDLQLLSLEYERYVSRAHTIFESFWNIAFSIIVGGLGIVLGLYQINVLKFNKYIFIIIIIINLFLISIVGFVAHYFWFDSRIKRQNIVEKINQLRTT